MFFLNLTHYLMVLKCFFTVSRHTWRHDDDDDDGDDESTTDVVLVTDNVTIRHVSVL